MPRADAVAGVLSFLLVALLGFDEGGFSPPSWIWSAALLAAAAGALFTGRAAKPALLETWLLAALAGLLAWTLVSTAWSLDPSASVLESERLLLYLAAAAALVLLARRSSPAPMLAGALCAVAALCLVGLVDVLVGNDPVGAVSADPGSSLRLSEPVGYANAVAILAVMGVLLALGLASRERRAAVRAACFALVPLLLATLYFTYGRGAWLALGLGLGVALAVGPNRRALALAGLAAAPVALAAVFAAAALDHQAALAALLALCAGAAAVVGIWLPGLDRSLDRRLGLALAGAAVAAAVLVIAGAGGPIALARDAYRSFTTPTDAASGSGRLLTLAGAAASTTGASPGTTSRITRRSARAPAAIGATGIATGRCRSRHGTRTASISRPSPSSGRSASVLLLVALGAPVAAAITRGDSLRPPRSARTPPSSPTPPRTGTGSCPLSRSPRSCALPPARGLRTRTTGRLPDPPGWRAPAPPPWLAALVLAAYRRESRARPRRVGLGAIGATGRPPAAVVVRALAPPGRGTARARRRRGRTHRLPRGSRARRRRLGALGRPGACERGPRARARAREAARLNPRDPDPPTCRE